MVNEAEKCEEDKAQQNIFLWSLRVGLRKLNIQLQESEEKRLQKQLAAATAEATEEATAEATKEKNELKMKIAKLKEQLEHRLRSRRLNPQTRRVTEGSRPPLLTE